MIENGQVQLVFDWNDCFFEMIFFLGVCCMFLVFYGIGVDIVMGEIVFGCDQVGRNVLWNDIVVKVDFWIGYYCIIIRVYWDV